MRSAFSSRSGHGRLLYTLDLGDEDAREEEVECGDDEEHDVAQSHLTVDALKDVEHHPADRGGDGLGKDQRLVGERGNLQSG